MILRLPPSNSISLLETWRWEQITILNRSSNGQFSSSFFRFTERNKPHRAPAKFHQMKTTAAALPAEQSNMTRKSRKSMKIHKYIYKYNICITTNASIDLRSLHSCSILHFYRLKLRVFYAMKSPPPHCWNLGCLPRTSGYRGS